VRTIRAGKLFEKAGSTTRGPEPGPAG